MRLEMLSKIVGSTKVFAARLDRALVRTFLGMGAIVTLEMLHPLEALTAVADVVFISRADNERRWTSVASALRADDGSGMSFHSLIIACSGWS